MILSVTTTVASLEDARRLARAMVEARLAACAQIEAIESVYVWEGALQQVGEQRITFKTTDARYGAFEAALRAAHPYQLPMIVALPLEFVLADYAAWVAAMTRIDT